MKHLNLIPNPTAVLLKPVILKEQIKNGIFLTDNQDYNSKQLEVVAMGNKIDKRFDMTLKSKVIISGGIPITIEDVQYVVSVESQILLVIND
jgi:co-chaperonin GroES (HSP10)